MKQTNVGESETSCFCLSPFFSLGFPDPAAGLALQVPPGPLGEGHLLWVKLSSPYRARLQLFLLFSQKLDVTVPHHNPSAHSHTWSTHDTQLVLSWCRESCGGCGFSTRQFGKRRSPDKGGVTGSQAQAGRSCSAQSCRQEPRRKQDRETTGPSYQPCL